MTDSKAAGPERDEPSVVAEHAFRALFEGAPVPLLVSDDEGRHVDANPAAVALLGVGREAIIGRRLGDFGEDGSGLAERWAESQRAGRLTGALSIRRPDGTSCEVEASAIADIRPGRHVVALRDQSELRAAQRATQLSEEALRASNARFRAMVENAAEAIWLCARDGVVTYASPATRQILGCEPETLVGAPVVEALAAQDSASLLEAMRRTYVDPSTIARFTVGAIGATGGERWLECTCTNMLGDPAVAGLVLNLRDVTDRRRAEAASIESSRLLESAQALAQLGSWTSSIPGGTIRWSVECARICGRSYDDPPTLDEWIQMVHPDDRRQMMVDTEEAVAAGVPLVTELRIIRPTGEIVWVHLRTLFDAPIAWSDERLTVTPDSARPGPHMLGVVQDVTARKKAEQQLRESADRYRSIVENTSDGVWLTDASAMTLFVNQRLAEMLGYSVEEMLGKPATAFLHEEDQPQVEARLEERKRGIRGRGELRLKRRDGSELWAWVHADPILDERGRLERILGLVSDATERRELEAGRNHLAAIVESSDDAIIGVTTSGEIQSWNKSAQMLFGYAAAEAIGQPAAILLPAELAEVEGLVLARALRGEAVRHYETVRRTKTGARVSVSLSVSPILDPSGRVIGAAKIIRDVTERRRAEEERNRLAAIVESSDDAVISCDPQGLIQSWNPGAERLTQYKGEEVRGKHLSTLFAPGEFAALTVDSSGAVTAVSMQHRELAALRKDGSTVEAMLTSSPLRDHEGRQLGVSVVIRDVSERRRYEEKLQRTEDLLRQAQKMEAVGSLAGGVAHDFNNLLSVILGYTNLMMGDLVRSDPLRADLEEIHSAGLKASALTQQLLAFSRKQILQPAVLDVNDVLSRLQRMLGRLLGEDIELLFAMSAVGKIYADPGQIEQVVMNLVVNARDAMPDGGVLTIETANVTLDAQYAADHPDVTPGSYVLIAVTDTGVGMSRETQRRIFEPFFTTKEKGRGTGLGLSTVYGIVKQSEGHLWVYSELGTGSTFKIYLPRTDRSAERVALTSLEAASVRGHETVLLVEDEDQVRGIVRTVLKKNGYHVLEAANGGEAFLVCEQYPSKIDLLVTDVVMPRMSGRQLAERLRTLRPHLKVLFVSGYTENTIVHHGVLDAGVEFLPKPVLPDVLLRKVRSILDS